MKMAFTIEAGGRVYQGELDTNNDPELYTLPMMANILLIKLADDHPDFQKADTIQLTARITNETPSHD